MSEPLDFQKLESAYWRAMCRHEMSELEMVMAATIVRLSFVIGEPFLRLDYAALNTAMELHLRLTDSKAKPLRNPGGWSRDKYFEIRGEQKAAATS